MLKKAGSLMKTSSVLVCPMMMMTDPVMMETSGVDDKPHHVQDMFVHAEGNTMCEVRESYMLAMTCPTGGLHNILRYAEPPDVRKSAVEAPAARRGEEQHAVQGMGHQDGGRG